MDKPVAPTKGLTRLQLILLAVGGVLLLAIAFSIAALLRWARAEVAVDASRLNFGVIKRGDLDRDVSGRGTIVAARFTRPLVQPRGRHRVAVGEGRHRGDEGPAALARVDSPELMSRRVQGAPPCRPCSPTWAGRRSRAARRQRA